jgi:hypothetical protein
MGTFRFDVLHVLKSTSKRQMPKVKKEKREKEKEKEKKETKRKETGKRV